MKAYILETPGNEAGLKIKDLPAPHIKEGEVLIEVKAFSINPVDVKTREGKGIYGRIKDTEPLILGWDVSGIVVETKSSSFSVGDEVFGMINFPGSGNVYAEYVAAPAEHLAKKPSEISHAEAAAATLAALTALQALVKHAAIKQGDKILIHAAAGGVGHYAVQLAKHLGAYVYGTSSSRNREFVLSLGADEHIDYISEQLTDRLSDVDFVLDTIGGSNIDASLPVLRTGGTLISIPTGVGETQTGLARERGVNAFFFLVSSDGEGMRTIADLLRRGILKSHVSAEFRFPELPEAHRQIETGRTVGKIVVVM